MKGILTAILLFVLAFPACNKYAKLLKKGTPDEKYAAAKRYYEKKDYFRATPLFEDLIGTYKQKKESQDVYLLYAYCQFYQNEYSMAAYHFKNFAETYSYSPFREEAAFMSAKCEFEKSLPSPLDQTNTKTAIARLQLFVNQYPDSKYIPECNSLMDELRAKLHKKTYDKAILFYNIGDYKAAVVSMKSAVNLYPDIPWKDEMMFTAANAAYQYADNSIVNQQIERYNDALILLEEYNLEYRGEGLYQADAVKLEKKIREKLAKVKK
jgi:outer membrane protein assembly factor BamD